MQAHGVDGTFDLVLVGTGFASTFFLHRYLASASTRTRVLVLERGPLREHATQLANRGMAKEDERSSFTNLTPEKPWAFSFGLGGNSNCWWACTPRFLPADFRMRSLHGVGEDWPLSYDDLEPYYGDAEDIMAVSGPADGSPYPRSRPYPQPPHRFTDPDKLLKRRFPNRFFNQPTARPSRDLASGRPRCCGNGVCDLCPIDSKFTILNTLRHLYEDPRVTLRLSATVNAVDVTGSVAQGVRYVEDGVERVAAAHLVGLGANAIFNPFLLMRSGLGDPVVGRGLAEQVSATVTVDLSGIDNFQGSTSITGLGYMFYDGAHRSTRAGALMEAWNVPNLRNERDKWRQRLVLKFIYEDLRRPENQVNASADGTRPEVRYAGPSAFSTAGLSALESDLSGVLSALPTEGYRVSWPGPSSSESHILGTTVMGISPSTSVIDSGLMHHRVRNLLVLGGGAFPTTTPANPTLTICALSLRAADRLARTASSSSVS